MSTSTLTPPKDRTALAELFREQAGLVERIQRDLQLARNSEEDPARPTVRLVEGLALGLAGLTRTALDEAVYAYRLLFLGGIPDPEAYGQFLRDLLRFTREALRECICLVEMLGSGVLIESATVRLPRLLANLDKGQTWFERVWPFFDAEQEAAALADAAAGRFVDLAEMERVLANAG